MDRATVEFIKDVRTITTNVHICFTHPSLPNGIELSGEVGKTPRQFAPDQLDFKRRDALSEGGAATLRASPFLLE